MKEMKKNRFSRKYFQILQFLPLKPKGAQNQKNEKKVLKTKSKRNSHHKFNFQKKTDKKPIFSAKN